MDEAGYLRLIRGEQRGPLASAARFTLGLAAMGYGLGVAVRNQAFDRGWRPIRHAGVPVVSVGNLTLGGTGKTPTVEYVARWYRAAGVRVAILSRGYGQQYGLNDEGRVLEENLPDVPHLQDRDRAGLARVAVEELESELLVLDDGFQHRRLARDLDLVLIDALDPFGLGQTVSPRPAARAGARAAAGGGRASCRAPTWWPDPTARRSAARPSAGPGRSAGSKHAMPRSTSSMPRVKSGRSMTSLIALSPHSAGSATPRASASPWPGVARRCWASAPSPTITPTAPPTWPTWPPGRAASGPIWS